MGVNLTVEEARMHDEGRLPESSAARSEVLAHTGASFEQERLDHARILLADDKDLFLDSTAALLRKAGYACQCAGDAVEAAQALRAGSFDLLIADINMPGNTRLEFLREVQAFDPPLPVVIVTAYPSVATAVEALRLAVVDYLVKPLDFGELLDRARRAIDKGRAIRSARRLQANLSGWLNDLGHFQEAVTLPGPSFPAGGIERRNPADALRVARGPGGDAAELSRREREIVGALASGQRVASVAASLRISTHTVRNHLKAVYRKFGVHSQVELLGRLRAVSWEPRTS
jgi:DNA-binding NarL/FixJ family response regulator